MQLRPETALLRQQVLNGRHVKRTLAATASGQAWRHRSIDPAKSIAPEYVIEPPREPLLVHLSHKELEHCQTWEEMSALLGMKGVPHERLQGKPDVRIDERDDGLMIEIA